MSEMRMIPSGGKTHLTANKQIIDLLTINWQFKSMNRFEDFFPEWRSGEFFTPISSTQKGMTSTEWKAAKKIEWFYSPTWVESGGFCFVLWCWIELIVSKETNNVKIRFVSNSDTICPFEHELVLLDFLSKWGLALALSLPQLSGKLWRRRLDN